MRSPLNVVTAACLACLALTAAGPAEAHGYGWRGGVYVGVGPYFRPYWGPGLYGAGYYGGYGGYYGSPYYGWPYSAAQPVVVAAAPTVYVERSEPAPVAAPPSGYWYWCSTSRAYYPTVPSCASAWVPVAPR